MITTVLDPALDARPARTSRHRIARWSAPPRFDVHRVPQLAAWVATQRDAGVRHLLIDCSAVRFIDLAAIEAVEQERRMLAAGRSIELADPSAAVSITLELLAAGRHDAPARHAVAA